MEAASSSSVFKTLVRCIFGPRLKRLFYASRNQEGRPYSPNKLERYSDNVILAASFLASFAYHVTPLYATYYIIRYGIPSASGVISTLRGFSFIPISVSIAFILRGIGRYRNKDYREFIKTLYIARSIQTTIGPEEARSTGIAQYDFEMFPYPVTFKHSDSTVRPRKLSSPLKQTLLERIRNLPLATLSYIGAHTVGRRLIYPGSNGILNLLLGDPLSMGRAKLTRLHGGYRAKLQSADGNCIDCMFIDKRGSPDATARGNKLMICCEGNAAYYEVGIMEVALQGGYSVLGWNHPGFAESTGLPFPDQEFNAIDVVIRFAKTRLGFTFEDIILFGWSIGGYTATCAAMSYPNIGGLILDATFDELTPLVKKQSPQLLEGVAKDMVRDYFNLNIADQASCYHGPILIIRREHDEMMTVNQGDLSSNRANYLLIKILQTRYPALSDAECLRGLQKWLSASNRESVLREYHVDRSYCKAIVQGHIGKEYPWMIGENLTLSDKTRLLLYLVQLDPSASQYMVCFSSTHCVPLPVDLMMQLPAANSGNIRT